MPKVEAISIQAGNVSTGAVTGRSDTVLPTSYSNGSYAVVGTTSITNNAFFPVSNGTKGSTSVQLWTTNQVGDPVAGNQNWLVIPYGEYYMGDKDGKVLYIKSGQTKGTSPTQVTFASAFPDNQYAILVTSSNHTVASASYYGMVVYGSVTASGFQVRTFSDGALETDNIPFNWITISYGSFNFTFDGNNNVTLQAGNDTITSGADDTVTLPVKYANISYVVLCTAQRISLRAGCNNPTRTTSTFTTEGFDDGGTQRAFNYSWVTINNGSFSFNEGILPQSYTKIVNESTIKFSDKNINRDTVDYNLSVKPKELIRFRDTLKKANNMTVVTKQQFQFFADPSRVLGLQRIIMQGFFIAEKVITQFTEKPVQAFEQVVTEMFKTVDKTIRNANYGRILSELSRSQEQAGKFGNYIRLIKDNFSSIDRMLKSFSLTIIRKETANFFDKVNKFAGFSKALTEKFNIADKTTRNVGFTRLVGDMTKFFDKVQKQVGYTRIAKDTAKFFEKVSKVAGFNRLVSDKFGAKESILKNVGFLRVIKDSFSATDKVIKSLSFERVLNEFSKFFDSVSTTAFYGVQHFTREVAEAFRFIDTVMKSFGTERINKDRIAFFDRVMKFTGLTKTLGERFNFVDTLGKSFGGEKIIKEGALFIDKAVKQVSFNAIRKETVNFFDKVSKSFGASRIIQDTARFKDTVLKSAGYEKLLKDSFKVVDTVFTKAQRNFSFIATEVSKFFDSIIRSQGFGRLLDENIRFRDTLVKSFGVTRIIQETTKSFDEIRTQTAKFFERGVNQLIRFFDSVATLLRHFVMGTCQLIKKFTSPYGGLALRELSFCIDNDAYKLIYRYNSNMFIIPLNT